jgi:uncharacterized protein
MPNPEGSFIWYELMTGDSEAAKAFYEPVVGWSFGEPVAEFNGYRMIQRSDGGSAGGVLPINDDMTSHGARPGWLGYISVGDVDEKVAAIEAAGGKTWMAPMDITGVGRVALVTDPQSAPFYVMKPIPPAGNPDASSDVFSPDGVGRCGWNELQTTDVDAARRFYADQFGWGSEEFMDMGPMGEYRFFDQGGTRIGALYNPQSGQPGKWRFYFRVESIAAAKRAAEAKGGTIHTGPHQVPTGDWVVVGSDPQGAEFALVGGE